MNGFEGWWVQNAAEYRELEVGMYEAGKPKRKRDPEKWREYMRRYMAERRRKAKAGNSGVAYG